MAVVDDCGKIQFLDTISQVEIHKNFGGVVPELASRQHFLALNKLYKQAEEIIKKDQIKIVKVVATTCPGLIGPLVVGSSFARGLASGWQLPFVGVHHLRGHVASVLLNRKATLSLREQAKEIFPAVVLLASGGHSQILSCDFNLDCQLLADTADDAAGECFDKAAKLLGLDYPGGPAIEKEAACMSDLSKAQEYFKALPQPKAKQGYSFSGLKTAIRYFLRDSTDLALAEFCWAVQEAICQTLLAGLKRSTTKIDLTKHKSLILCGGVAANLRLRTLLEAWANENELCYFSPKLSLCMDNAAMIGAAAWVQQERHNCNELRSRALL